MNKKELGELRRRFRADRSAISHIYGCFVNCNREIVSDLDLSLGLMTQEEGEKYLGFLKKALSGTLGRNLMDIEFTTRQVAEGEEHRLLSALRKTRLKDEDLRRQFYQKVIGTLDLEGNYLILLAHDAYDVPYKGKDGEVDRDGSDEVFSYIVCAICPIKDGKVELGYFPMEKAFHCVSGQTVTQPELGFLFPAFDDRSTNLYNALFYSRNTEDIHQEFIDAVFRTEPPMSAAEQKESFRNVLVDALEEECDMEVLQAIHDQIGTRMEEHKQSKDPEPFSMTAKEFSYILEDCGVSDAHTASFKTLCREQFGEDAALLPNNLIDTGKFQIKTSQATISLGADNCYLVEERIIDGKRYLLIPAEEGMELNGLPIRIKRREE